MELQLKCGVGITAAERDREREIEEERRFALAVPEHTKRHKSDARFQPPGLM